MANNSTTEKADASQNRVAGCKWHISYLNKIARELRTDARKSARAQGFEPMFDKGNSFSVGINASGDPYVQVNYTINGINQASNCAI